MSITHTPSSLLSRGLIIIAFDKKEGRDVANTPSYGSYFGSSFTVEEMKENAEKVGLSFDDVNIGQFFIEEANRWAMVAPMRLFR